MVSRECRTGHVFASSVPAALDAALVKLYIMLCRGQRWAKGFIARWAQGQTLEDYDYRVLVERS